jgi:hypothetical protein
LFGLQFDVDKNGYIGELNLFTDPNKNLAYMINLGAPDLLKVFQSMGIKVHTSHNSFCQFFLHISSSDRMYKHRSSRPMLKVKISPQTFTSLRYSLAELVLQVEDEIIDAMLRATDRDGDGQISIKVGLSHRSDELKRIPLIQ